MILKPGFFYFLIVFAAGFALGIVRVLLLVPQLGVRSAELIELPLMLAASAFAARWIVTRFNVTGLARRLGVSGIALGFLLFAEFGVVAALQGRSVIDAITQRDPVSGTAYFISLVLFGLMPLLVARML